MPPVRDKEQNLGNVGSKRTTYDTFRQKGAFSESVDKQQENVGLSQGGHKNSCVISDTHKIYSIAQIITDEENHHRILKSKQDKAVRDYLKRHSQKKDNKNKK